MTVGTYAPRCPVHPDRHGVRKTNGHNLWLVLHTSEGGESTSSAESLAAYMGMPGDRPGGYGSSYQAVFDTDQIIPAVPNDVVSYSAGGGNAQGVHGCFPGKAAQTTAQWLDTNSRAMIRQAAAWLIDQSRAEGIPLRRLTVDQVRNHVAGVCDHHDISLAFRKSTHTDIGEQFPWNVLWADIAELLAPPTTVPPRPPLEFTDMEITFRLKSRSDVVKIVDNVPMPLSAHALDVEIASGTANPYGVKSSSTSNPLDPRQSPAPFHAPTAKWLEHQLGYPLTPSPSGV